jgi:hypothetical protein
VREKEVVPTGELWPNRVCSPGQAHCTAQAPWRTVEERWGGSLVRIAAARWGRESAQAGQWGCVRLWMNGRKQSAGEDGERGVGEPGTGATFTVASQTSSQRQAGRGGTGRQALVPAGPPPS